MKHIIKAFSLSFISLIFASNPPTADDLKVVKADDIAHLFATAPSVVSDAKKFIIQVKLKPGTIMQALVDPDTGKPLTAYGTDVPIGEQGVIFKNPTDNSWQGINNDDQGVIIVNRVSDFQAKVIYNYVKTLIDQQSDQRLTAKDYQDILNFIYNTQGLTDFYNSDMAFIDKNMRVVDQSLVTKKGDGLFYGYMKRDRKDKYRAVKLELTASFAGPAGVPQRFSANAVIVKADGLEQEIRLIQSDVFLKTYTLENGNQIDINTLPVYHVY